MNFAKPKKNENNGEMQKQIENPTPPVFYGSPDMLIRGLQTSKQSHSDIVDAFNIIDFENNGYIDNNDLRRALHVCAEEFEEHDIDNMLRMVDYNADGKIQFRHLKIYFVHHRQYLKIMI